MYTHNFIAINFTSM